MLAEMMAPARSAPSSSALLLAQIVVEALFGVGAMFGLQKSISRSRAAHGKTGNRGRGCRRSDR
jgi:hypothetical protein